MINKSFESKSTENSMFKIEDIDDVNIYETVTTVRRRRVIDKPISTVSNIPISTNSNAMTLAVKLRESAVQRRQRRNGVGKDEPPHSSSGNWSASSESGRTSIGSEITTQPKSTTSCGTTSSNSLNTHSLLPSSVASRRKFVSTSGSVTSEGTLTPDIIHDLQHDDDGESSVYSCDTEGYYTSFHVDSGLKTLKEEDISLPSTPLQVTSAFQSPDRNLSAENEYELFGKGSTSTTTSSAGTVCTTLMASGSQRSLLNVPAVPERKSSLTKIDTGTIKRNKATVVAMVHKTKGDISPDSGHNTSSSPIESISSPNGQRSCSEFEFSESSDLEGVDRIERIRIKTTINSSRIPSMCVITPPHSDDESIKSMQRYEIHSKHDKQPLETDIDADLPPKMQLVNINPTTGYAMVEATKKLQPLNILGKLRSLAQRKTPPKEIPEDIYDTAGEYVTIADVRNNNKTGYCPTSIPDTEYVSLNELPIDNNSLERKRRQGARVTLDSEGKVIYSSDSLRRRKGAHTTFEPGPFVKEPTTPTPSPLLARTPKKIRPLSPQLNKLIIRAAVKTEAEINPPPTADLVRIPPTNIVTPLSPLSPKARGGAYVNMQGIESKPNEGKNQSKENRITQNNNKLSRNDSYRIANSPLVIINQTNKRNFNLVKKLDDSNEDAELEFERELAAELLRERINYPPTVSPKLDRGFSRFIETDFIYQSPSKVTLPHDSCEHQAKILSTTLLDTEIW